MNRICAVAGRSGGHIIPCLTYCEKQLKKEDELLFFSTHVPLDKKIAKQHTTISQHVTLHLDNVPRCWYQWPLFATQLSWSFVKSVVWLLRKRPQKIITTGGYVAIPVCLAGWILRIPYELFELNVVPGKAITFLAKRAKKIHICFTDTKKYIPAKKIVETSYPIRFQENTDKKNYQEFELDPQKKTILILGGSQGSDFLNSLSPVIAEYCLQNNVQVLHQTGTKNNPVQDVYQQYNVTSHVFSFSAHPENLYQLADLVICRAGSGTLFETAHFKKPAIIIPLEAHTTTHQLDNAFAFEKQYPTSSVARHKDLQANPLLLFKLLQSKIG